MNHLFPIFVKIEHLQVLVVGGGNVGLEKLSAILKNCPQANVTIVADRFLEETLTLAENHSNTKIFRRKFEYDDLIGKDLVILATDQHDLHPIIKAEARKRGILTNVADTPHLCDFYLGSIVQKGDLKIAISTNGKSPTLAKRLREYFEEVIPDEIQSLMEHLQQYRNTLKGNFKEKIVKLDELTKKLMD
jgi:siroheme synthase-like protein